MFPRINYPCDLIYPALRGWEIQILRRLNLVSEIKFLRNKRKLKYLSSITKKTHELFELINDNILNNRSETTNLNNYYEKGFPFIMNEKELAKKLSITRKMAKKLMGKSDFPTLVISGEKFVCGYNLEKWLKFKSISIQKINIDYYNLSKKEKALVDKVIFLNFMNNGEFNHKELDRWS